jgi:hypothetical protein
MSTKRKVQKATPWQPLRPAESKDPDVWARNGMRAPDRIYVNNLFSVYVREIGKGALHISFHRHSRGAVRDWRHFQAIKNEVAGPERLAVEVFPPESMLVDEANEYHLWVFSEGSEGEFPFLLPGRRQVGTREDMEREQGRTRARQRNWQPGIPTGKGFEEYTALL